ncbi:MAG: histidine kinase [Alphaproteobacteria bacterium]
MSDPKVTTFLATDENTDGWRLEEILRVIQHDIVRRMQKITGDSRPEARAVLNNNIAILGNLSDCIARAEDSTQLLDRAFGPHKDGEPRIGVL